MSLSCVIYLNLPPVLLNNFIKTTKIYKYLAFIIKILYNDKAVIKAKKGRAVYTRSCRYVGPVRQRNVNHVRRGTEQH